MANQSKVNFVQRRASSRTSMVQMHPEEKRGKPVNGFWKHPNRTSQILSNLICSGDLPEQGSNGCSLVQIGREKKNWKVHSKTKADLPNLSKRQFVLGSCPTGILSGTNPPRNENCTVRFGFVQQKEVNFLAKCYQVVTNSAILVDRSDV